MKLAHVALWTTDVETAAEFWQRYFGAEIGPRYESRNRAGFVSRFVRIAAAELQVELMQGPWVAPPPGEASGWAHIALSVGSRAEVDRLAAGFEADGLLVSAPRRTGDGYYEAVVRTPDGTLVEIVE